MSLPPISTVILSEAEESKLFPQRVIASTKYSWLSFPNPSMVSMLKSIHRTLPSNQKLEPYVTPQDSLKGSQLLNNWKSLLLVAIIYASGIVAALWLWVIPAWQTISTVTVDANKIQLQVELIQAIAQVLLGSLLLVTLYVAWRRAAAAERAVEVSQEGQITERFTRAIQQMGNENMAIRLGGIYALERIARDSEKDHSQVMEVLTAYVRENSPARWDLDPMPFRLIPSDIQAILEVLGRREVSYDRPDHKLNLGMTNLTGADLEGAVLQNVDLRMANLHNAFLKDANLRGANMFQASIRNATFEGADLRGANLGVVRHFSDVQLDSALLDDTTRLPTNSPDKEN